MVAFVRSKPPSALHPILGRCLRHRSSTKPTQQLCSACCWGRSGEIG
jgi:hypothetical protein